MSKGKAGKASKATAKKPNKLSDQYRKSTVRKTAAWRQLRTDIAEEYNNTDALTLRPLRLGWNVHHLDMDVNRYDDLSIEKFRPLNKSSHDLVHTVFRYYAKDPDILERLKAILDEMVKYARLS